MKVEKLANDTKTKLILYILIINNNLKPKVNILMKE